MVLAAPVAQRHEAGAEIGPPPQQQHPDVVSDQVQAPVLDAQGPADPVVPGRAFERGGREGSQSPSPKSLVYQILSPIVGPAPRYWWRSISSLKRGSISRGTGSTLSSERSMAPVIRCSIRRAVNAANTKESRCFVRITPGLTQSPKNNSHWEKHYTCFSEA